MGTRGVALVPFGVILTFKLDHNPIPPPLTPAICTLYEILFVHAKASTSRKLV